VGQFQAPFTKVRQHFQAGEAKRLRIKSAANVSQQLIQGEKTSKLKVDW
jgi:hypothetical protein